MVEETTPPADTSQTNKFKLLAVFGMLAVIIGIAMLMVFILRPDPPSQCVYSEWKDTSKCTKDEQLALIHTQCAATSMDPKCVEDCKYYAAFGLAKGRPRAHHERDHGYGGN